MRKITLALLVLSSVILSSCATSNPDLYSWGGKANGTSAYGDRVYKQYKNQTPEALCVLLVTYETMVSNPGGERMVPPPGICAEYGYMLLNPDVMDVFSENATDKQKKVLAGKNYIEYGVELLNREIQYYPEAKRFLEPIIKRIKHEED